jgi:hypothetical protein
MLDRYGLLLGQAFTALESAKVLCLPLQIPEGEREVSNREIALATAHGLDLMRQACLACGMQGVVPELDRIVILIEPRTFAPRLGISQAINHLLSRVKDDLSFQNFYRVAPEDFQFYGRADLFGQAVAKKFKGAVMDIQNAGNCLALGQGTACVFHLMRAMELTVRQLGRRLNVTITPQTTWRQMTGQMDDKIKKMPETTDRLKHKRNDWEAARANLHAVGSVWRNNTMHPATSYTPSQARDVMNAVRVFMISLAEL